MGAARGRREGDEVAGLELMFTVGVAERRRTVGDQQPFLFVLLVVRAERLAGRCLVEPYVQRRAAGLAESERLPGDEAVGLGAVVGERDVVDVDRVHTTARSLSAPR